MPGKVVGSTWYAWAIILLFCSRHNTKSISEVPMQVIILASVMLICGTIFYVKDGK